LGPEGRRAPRASYSARGFYGEVPRWDLKAGYRSRSVSTASRSFYGEVPRWDLKAPIFAATSTAALTLLRRGPALGPEGEEDHRARTRGSGLLRRGPALGPEGTAFAMS